MADGNKIGVSKGLGVGIEVLLEVAEGDWTVFEGLGIVISTEPLSEKGVCAGVVLSVGCFVATSVIALSSDSRLSQATKERTTQPKIRRTPFIITIFALLLE
ncbi:MAG TPA: hypothetical protein VFI27_13270 [candidate division Zixibacteria bacterium]|nr:hypothetical protein [candidate division Zixibacteria bacterium]